MKATLLIAEGNEGLCYLYKNYISKYGYKVETALDGLGCLAKLRCEMPAVLVLDWELCWGGGDGILAWLREQRGPSMPSVVLTSTAGYSLDAAPDTAFPIVRFLAKPFALTDLLDSVCAAFVKKECAQPFY